METDKMGRKEQKRDVICKWRLLFLPSVKEKNTSSKMIRYSWGRTWTEIVRDKMSEDCKLIIPCGERFAICLNSVWNVISGTTEKIMMVTHTHTQTHINNSCKVYWHDHIVFENALKKMQSYSELYEFPSGKMKWIHKENNVHEHQYQG